MNGGRDDDDGAGSEFRRALDDVRPADRKGLRREPVPELRPRAPERDPVRFETAHAGERLSGWARGTDRRLRKRLRNGEIEIERELDLHGLDAASARRTLRSALEAALAAGERCVLVIHGRGRHSDAGPTLKSALPDWLAEPPHGPAVLAFESADPRHGGPGATRVLLRPPRQPGSKR
ncbi:MAG: DNA mismatch repair protein MutS [Myxococcales bacterium]|nr:DNA mismatch repair protein MutS [Myxococcales bacterium]